MKNYKGLILLNSYSERLEYLKTYDNNPGNRNKERDLLNAFYRSRTWRDIRKLVIQRDLFCDLGIPGLEIQNKENDKLGTIVVHHIVPITLADLENESDLLMSMDNLITCSIETHNQIHYSTNKFENMIIERKPGDTCPWKL
jgi:5-methylcytosine-specific restriction endonuclease McrA